MINTNEVHGKIIEILDKKGPSLPITIAKQIGMSSLFISAYLSELTDEKRIKVSHLKVGGSPLYFLDNQEEQLEKFYKYLHPREAEAFLLLKKKKILKDSEQEPAIRVALRSIRDFSIGFKQGEEIYWRYFSTPESEIKIPKAKKAIQKQPKTQTKKTSKKTKTKILTAGDVHGDTGLVKKLARKAKEENVDLIILAGDVTLMESEVENLIGPFVKLKKPVLLLHGNHESLATIDFLERILGAKSGLILNAYRKTGG